jgi:hypothetical protein
MQGRGQQLYFTLIDDVLADKPLLVSGRVIPKRPLNAGAQLWFLEINGALDAVHRRNDPGSG